MVSWADKHVLVTGGSSGTGLAAAEIAASRGAHVSIVARDVARLEVARESVSAARVSDVQHITAHSADVASWEAVEDAVRGAEQAAGPVDILVTCAGYCYPARFLEMPIEEFAGQIGVNLLGTIYAARAVAPGMVARGSGHIAMVSSLGGLVGVYGYSAYSPGKYGVIGFAEVLRSEMKPHGVGVSVVCPPNIDTPGYAREVAVEPPETARVNGSTKAVPPREIALLLVDAVDRGRFMVVPGFTNALLGRVNGLAPEVLRAFTDTQVAAARKEVAEGAS